MKNLQQMNNITDLKNKNKCDLPLQYMEYSLSADDQRQIDEKNRLVPIAFSSSEEIENFFGAMILDHNEKSVRLDRANQGRMPALYNHDRNLHLGTVQNITLGKDGKGRGVVKFAKNAFAEEKFQDVINGDLTSVSVGLRVHEVVLERESKTDGEVMRAIDWEPLEASFVTMPRDIAVGVSRDEAELNQVIIRREAKCLTKRVNKVIQRRKTVLIK